MEGTLPEADNYGLRAQTSAGLRESPEDGIDKIANLGPPLAFLPKDIERSALQAYRADYQAFRTGCATGAHGELGQLLGVEATSKDEQPVVTRRTTERQGRVSLIGLKLAASSAAMCAANAASTHHETVAITRTMSKLSLSGLESKTNAPDQPAQPALPVSDTELAKASNNDVAFMMSDDEEEEWPCASPPLVPATAGSLRGRQVTASGVSAQQDMGLLLHIAASGLCLLPCMLLPDLGAWQRLAPPGAYAWAIAAHVGRAGAHGAAAPPGSPGWLSWQHRLGRALRMERVVRDGCVPGWFPLLSAVCYVLIALLLALSGAYGSTGNAGGHAISFWGHSLKRHDYSCWGNSAEDVADCVLVRHASCTILVTFYICLLAAAACNRNVRGAGIVARHTESLLQLFPDEASSLFAYIGRTVDANAACWRSSRRYKAQAAAMSSAWTLLSYTVYAGLLADSKSQVARAAFIVAAPCTYTLQFTLLRHVLLRVLLYLEAVKARAAALAYCDEEEVLPFSSAHAIYVWFSVRRNVQAQNEVAYQHAKPIMVASLACAAACSCWVASELSHRGRSVFTLTQRGGGSLMAVGSAAVSCIFLSIFLGALLDIGKLEEEHTKQLRMAQCRLEHAKWWSRSAGMEDEEAASAMIDKVLAVLEAHDQRPTFFGVEIGSKSFKVVYAALLSNGWYLLVWGVLIPLMSSGDGS